MDADKPPDFQVLNVIDFIVLDRLPRATDLAPALPFDQPIAEDVPPIQYVIKREPQPRRRFRIRR